MKVFVSSIQYSNGAVAVRVLSTLANGTTYSTLGLDMDMSSPAVTDVAGFKARAIAAILDYSTANSLGLVEGDILFPDFFPGLVNAPQAAIADAPADATTNYNVLTTLLGTLTGAVNTANTKQNDIATKLNTLLAELRTLGLISA